VFGQDTTVISEPLTATAGLGDVRVDRSTFDGSFRIATREPVDDLIRLNLGPSAER
jgi:hypothetical protein